MEANDISNFIQKHHLGNFKKADWNEQLKWCIDKIEQIESLTSERDELKKENENQAKEINDLKHDNDAYHSAFTMDEVELLKENTQLKEAIKKWVTDNKELRDKIKELEAVIDVAEEQYNIRIK